MFLRDLTTGPLGPLWEARVDADGVPMDALARVITLPHGLSPAQQQALAQAAWDSTELSHGLILGVADVVFGKHWAALIHDFSEGTTLKSLLARAEERQSSFPVAVALRIALDIVRSVGDSRKLSEELGIPWLSGGLTAASTYVCGDGFARLLDGYVPAACIRSSSLRASPGALAYAAPEQLDPNHEPDERSDVFALGAIVWELLQGKPLLVGSQSAISQRVSTALPRLPTDEGGKQVPAAIVDAVAQALELDPARRFETLAEFSTSLAQAAPELANRGEVIDFIDALLHRESTLFRLLADPPPRLSERMKSVRPPKPDLAWAVDLAKRAKVIAQAHGTTPSGSAITASGTLAPEHAMPTKQTAISPVNHAGAGHAPVTGSGQNAETPAPQSAMKSTENVPLASKASPAEPPVSSNGGNGAPASPPEVPRPTSGGNGTTPAKPSASAGDGSGPKSDASPHRPVMKTLIGLNAASFMGTPESDGTVPFRAALDSSDDETQSSALGRAFPGAPQPMSQRAAVRVSAGSSPTTSKQPLIGPGADDTHPGLGFAAAMAPAPSSVDAKANAPSAPDDAEQQAAPATARSSPGGSNADGVAAAATAAATPPGRAKLVRPPMATAARVESGTGTLAGKPFAIAPPGVTAAPESSSAPSGTGGKLAPQATSTAAGGGTLTAQTASTAAIGSKQTAQRTATATAASKLAPQANSAAAIGSKQAAQRPATATAAGKLAARRTATATAAGKLAPQGNSAAAAGGKATVAGTDASPGGGRGAGSTGFAAASVPRPALGRSPDQPVAPDSPRSSDTLTAHDAAAAAKPARTETPKSAAAADAPPDAALVERTAEAPATTKALVSSGTDTASSKEAVPPESEMTSGTQSGEGEGGNRRIADPDENAFEAFLESSGQGRQTAKQAEPGLPKAVNAEETPSPAASSPQPEQTLPKAESAADTSSPTPSAPQGKQPPPLGGEPPQASMEASKDASPVAALLSEAIDAGSAKTPAPGTTGSSQPVTALIEGPLVRPLPPTSEAERTAPGESAKADRDERAPAGAALSAAAIAAAVPKKGTGAQGSSATASPDSSAVASSAEAASVVSSPSTHDLPTRPIATAPLMPFKSTPGVASEASTEPFAAAAAPELARGHVGAEELEAPFARKRPQVSALTMLFAATTLILAGVVIWLLGSRPEASEAPDAVTAPATTTKAGSAAPIERDAASVAASTQRAAKEADQEKAAKAAALTPKTDEPNPEDEKETEKSVSSDEAQGSAKAEESDSATTRAATTTKSTAPRLQRTAKPWRPKPKTEPKKKTYVPSDL